MKTNLVTTIYPFAYYEDDGSRTLREMMYEAPFTWYNRLHGVEPDDLKGVQDWHIKPFLDSFENVDVRREARSGEFAVMRLPVNVFLKDIVDVLPEFSNELNEVGGWRYADVWDMPLFVEAHHGRIHFGEMPRFCKNLWCLGSKVRIKKEQGAETMTVKIGAFANARVPTVLFPCLRWSLAWLGEKQSRGWTAELHHTLWDHASAKKEVGGIPILLVR